MSYQVLARKWRPATFEQMVGQSHVLHALTNALSQQRLHHAYLFTGTRGVGKTSLARLFAKGLNCEQGVTATPCGVCGSCVEIAQGRFVDLIEVDAASRTKVDDTRELLDNVQYRPTRGRFKVYLIDEVHMLSRSSFNALLKTLEEPPEHVKFLLATTDPQKLPVTVLSRCLQFNLKSLTQIEIGNQLQHILSEEQLPFEVEALTLLAKAANGSMRDALSLTDQAIAFGAGHVELKQVQTMLGSIDEQHVVALLATLVEADIGALMQTCAQVLAYGADAQEVLRSLLELLHQITLTQFAPAAAQQSLYSAQIRAFAEQLSPEQVQLYYQILLSGRKDLPHAPDPKSGLEMALLRAVAFVPEKPVKRWQVDIHSCNDIGEPQASSPTNAIRGALSAETSGTEVTSVTTDLEARGSGISSPEKKTLLIEGSRFRSDNALSFDKEAALATAPASVLTKSDDPRDNTKPDTANNSAYSENGPDESIDHVGTDGDIANGRSAKSDAPARDDVKAHGAQDITDTEGDAIDAQDAALIAEQTLILSQAQSLGFGAEYTPEHIKHAANDISLKSDAVTSAKADVFAFAQCAPQEASDILRAPDTTDVSFHVAPSIATTESETEDAFDPAMLADYYAFAASDTVDESDSPAGDYAAHDMSHGEYQQGAHFVASQHSPQVEHKSATPGLADDDILSAVLAARESLQSDIDALQAKDGDGKKPLAEFKNASAAQTGIKPLAVKTDAPVKSPVDTDAPQVDNVAAVGVLEHRVSATLNPHDRPPWEDPVVDAAVVSNPVAASSVTSSADASAGQHTGNHVVNRGGSATAPVAPQHSDDGQHHYNTESNQHISSQARRNGSQHDSGSQRGNHSENPQENHLEHQSDSQNLAEQSAPASPSATLTAAELTHGAVTTGQKTDLSVGGTSEPVTGHPLDLHWYKLMSSLDIGGRIRQLAVNSVYQIQSDPLPLLLKPDQKHLAADAAIAQLEQALSEALGMPKEISVSVGIDLQRETPLELRKRFHQELLAEAQESLINDDNVQWLIQRLGAQLAIDSLVYPTELLNQRSELISALPELPPQQRALP